MRGAIILAKRACALARRVLLPGSSALLLLVPLLVAHAQGPQTGEPMVRILSVSTPPLADAQLPEGGLVVALVNAGLGRSKAGVTRTDVRWAKAGSGGEVLSQEVLSDPGIDLFLPVESADCDRPGELTHALAVVCDHAVYSEPILQVVLGLFSLTTSGFKFDTDDSVLGKTVCVWRENDLIALNANGRNWASYKRITVLRRPSLLDCVVAVQAHDADAFVAIDLEGTHLLGRLGLAPYFAMQPRPLATRGVHAVIGRDNPRAAGLLAALNQGLKQLKQDGVYAALVQKHLMAAESPSVVTASAKEATPPPPTTAPHAAPLPKTPPPPTAPKATSSQQASLPPAVLKDVSPAPLAAPPVKAAPEPVVTAPVLDQAARAMALKFLKRGDEELAEGRIAPARLLYERAAEMGLAQAAMALAGTFDAAELAKPHLHNVRPDPSEAKRWYERAKGLGAAEAGVRLQRLGDTGR